MHRHLAIIAVLFTFSLVSSTTPKGATSDQIRGVVQGPSDGAVVPINQATVELRPVDGGPLIGIATTSPSGSFVVVALTDPQLLQDQPLLRDTTYQANIEVPGYYILRQSFDYRRGAEDWVFTLEERRTDDLGTDTNQISDGGGEPTLTFGGSVRSGN